MHVKVHAWHLGHGMHADFTHQRVLYCKHACMHAVVILLVMNQFVNCQVYSAFSEETEYILCNNEDAYS